MKVGILIAFMVLANFVVAQEISSNVIASSGAEISDGNLIINQTIGELVIENFSDDELILTQGFQQTTYTVTQIDQDNDSQVLVCVFPNPTSRFVNVVYYKEAYSCVLFNLNGSILRREEAVNGSVYIDLSAFSEGMYMLNLVDKRGQLIAQYKIVKN